MQALWLPESVCYFVDKKIKSAIWAKGDSNRSWHLVPWKDMICSKAEGGLGLRSTRVNNIAMLGKLIEHLLHDRGKLWVQAISQKYLSNSLVFTGSYSQGLTYI